MGNISKNLNSNFVYYLIIFVSVFLLVGKSVPFSNEPVYLLRLFSTYHADFLVGDLSFSTKGGEHWLFNHLFGLLTLIFNVSTVGWIGRIVCWTILTFALFNLAKHWKISALTVTISIIIWLAIGQTIVNDEWIFGGFEAKNIAYICLLFALDFFLRKRENIGSILLGLTFSFHPAVGLWAILAVGLAMILCRWEIKTIFRVVAITFLFSTIGIWSIWTENLSNSEDWKFFVIERASPILNPFSWSIKSLVVLGLMFVFVMLSDLEKFTKYFLFGLFCFFLLGFGLRFLEQWQLLCLMPLRLFPVFTPLFFFWTFFAVCKRKSFSTKSAFIALCAILLFFVFHNTIKLGFQQFSDTLQTWRAKPDGKTNAYLWLKENSPKDSQILSPIWDRNAWFYSERSQFVSFSYPPFENMTEWRLRVRKLVGEKTDSEEIQVAYKQIPSQILDELADKYGVNYVISQADYSYPKVFEDQDWKVYKLK